MDVVELLYCSFDDPVAVLWVAFLFQHFSLLEARRQHSNVHADECLCYDEKFTNLR